MIHDDELRTSSDYSAGQREAAHRVLIELVNLFDEYREEIRIVGGWVPDLMFPDAGHIGSIDVDILINHLKLQDSGYRTMEKILLKNGYIEHTEKYFSFLKNITINGVTYPVDVDILAGMYGGTQPKKRSQHVQGIKALKATGGNFAFDFEPQNIRVEAKRPDGSIDVAHVNLIAVVPYLVMKSAAMGRGKAKDAYDIYFLIKNYPGGVLTMTSLFENVKTSKIIRDMKTKLGEKFASVNHAGPVDIAEFIGAEGEERETILRDAFEQINALLSNI